MAKSALLFALVLLPAMAIAHRPMKTPLVLEGSVFCDTCVAGFETKASTPIAGAKVRVVCREREDASRITYSQEAVTDSKGCYKMFVNEDHGNEVCDAVLVKSPQPDCAVPAPGRESARVILTRNNGMCSDARYANPLGFTKLNPDRGCELVMKEFQVTDDQY